MGCCASGEVQAIRSSFDQAWAVFKGTDLAKPERFSQNCERVFRYLFLSVAIPATKQTVARVEDFTQSLKPGNPAGVQAQRELERLMQELDKLEKQRRELHQELAKRIQSDMLSVEEGEKKGSLRRDGQEAPQMPAFPREREKSWNSQIDPPQEKRAGSYRQSASEIQEANLRSSYGAYSIPVTVLDSAIEPLSKSGWSHEERLLETLEFETERRKALEEQVVQLARRAEQQALDLQELAGKRAALLEELQLKEHFIRGLRREETVERLKEELIEAGRDREGAEDRAAQLRLELEQYRSEASRLDREREEAVRENKYLSSKVRELSETLSHTLSLTEDTCNHSHSLSVLPARAMGVVRAVEERVEPTLEHLSSFSSRGAKQVGRSFVIVEEEDASSLESSYAILFNLFANSRVLPSHADFQAAVGTRTIIAELFDRRPLRSELLFAFDPISPNHFARYIEDRQNLLLLVALPNGLVLGGFAGAFAPQSELQDSFLFSLGPHREPVKLLPARRVRRIDLDPSFLVFGNGELRVKAKTLEVTCNAGSFQSLYAWGKRSVPIEKFLGGTERAVLATSYEVHQLHFDDL